MITEYVDCTELKRLIVDKKLKTSAFKAYLKQKGIIFTASNAEQFAEQIYTVFLGSSEISEIRDIMINDNNYEKSLVMNLCLKSSTDGNILDIILDEINKYKSEKVKDYTLEMPVKEQNSISVQFSYQRKSPGRNRLLEYEKRFLKLNIRKISDKKVTIDIRQPSSIDSKHAVEFIQKIAGNNEFKIEHINLNSLVTSNKVEFFDQIAKHKFESWRLKTITGITVKRGNSDDANEEDDEGEIIDDEGQESQALSGINQAILNGNELRLNKFVQDSIDRGYYIAAMRYRYEHTREATEFAINLSFKNNDLKVEIDKTYWEEDGRISVQPFLKTEQNGIIIEFQNVADEVYQELISHQHD